MNPPLREEISASTALHLAADEYDHMVERGAFDHLKRKIELIGGEIREMNPAGPLHNDYILYLNNWSVRSTESKTILVGVQVDVILAKQESRPEPDLCWVVNRRYRDMHPTGSDVRLAIEVSDSSLNSDLIEKSALYAEAGIIEYWVVDVQGHCIHVCRSPTDGQYDDRSVVKPGEHLAPLGTMQRPPLEPCSQPLDLKDLFGTD